MYSYVDWRRIRLPKESDVDVLGPECDNYPTSASSQIYYYNYPYRVDLESEDWSNCFTIYDERRNVALRKLMLEEFCDKELERGLRSYISNDVYRVYLQSYHDLLTFLAFFSEQVKHVHGPISKSHISAMVDPDCHCVIRPPYWKKYDIKVYVTTKTPSFRLFLGSAVRSSMRTSVKEFLQDNLPAECQLWRGDLYTMHKELTPLLPFLALQFPDARLIITKCINER